MPRSVLLLRVALTVLVLAGVGWVVVGTLVLVIPHALPPLLFRYIITALATLTVCGCQGVLVALAVRTRRNAVACAIADADDSSYADGYRDGLAVVGARGGVVTQMPPRGSTRS